ncbi:MAG: hypothetical protein ACE5KE_00375 [Methanosarcinales archaeon]
MKKRNYFYLGEICSSIEQDRNKIIIEFSKISEATWFWKNIDKIKMIKSG